MVVCLGGSALGGLFLRWNIRFPPVGAQACTFDFAHPFDGFDRLPFDKLRVCDTASRLRMILSPSTPLGTLSLSNGRSRMGQGPEQGRGAAPNPKGATRSRPYDGETSDSAAENESALAPYPARERRYGLFAADCVARQSRNQSGTGLPTRVRDTQVGRPVPPKIHRAPRRRE